MNWESYLGIAGLDSFHNLLIVCDCVYIVTVCVMWLNMYDVFQIINRVLGLGLARVRL